MKHVARKRFGQNFLTDKMVLNDIIDAIGPRAGETMVEIGSGLAAMTALDVPPSGCLVVEDSLVGVTAGLAAGAAVLGVPSLQPLEPMAGMVHRPTLTGLTVPELARLVGEAGTVPAPL